MARPALRGNRVRLILVGALAGGIGVGVGAGLALQHGPAGAAPPDSSAALPGMPAQAVWAPGARRAPGFQLRDEDRARVSLRSERGRPLLLAFLDSRCKQECPIEGKLLGQVWRRRTPALHPLLLIVSVNPWQDTPASARAFVASKIGWGGVWHWLFGTPKTLAPVWRAYDIEVKRSGGTIGHGAGLYMIDRAGFMRRGYLVPFTPATVVADLRAITRAS